MYITIAEIIKEIGYIKFLFYQTEINFYFVEILKNTIFN